MAKDTNRAPGQIRQMIDIYKLTIKQDKSAGIIALVIVLAGIGLIYGIGAAVAPGNVLNQVIFSILGLLFGIVAAMVFMGRRAERTAYSRIEGQLGAVGAVVGNALKRGWRSAEMPVAVNPRSQDAVYRAIGPGGVVLIGEGSRTRVQQLLEDERRKVQRVAPGAPIQFIYVTGDAGSVGLPVLVKSIYKLKKVMNRAEIGAVAKRLESLQMNIPIPKGMDPNRMGKMRRQG